MNKGLEIGETCLPISRHVSGNKTRFLEIGESLEKRPRNRRNLVYLFLDMFSSNLVYLFLDIFSSKKGPMASSMIVLH